MDDNTTNSTNPIGTTDPSVNPVVGSDQTGVVQPPAATGDSTTVSQPPAVEVPPVESISTPEPEVPTGESVPPVSPLGGVTTEDTSGGVVPPAAV